jgi:hypothetical protein
MHVVRFSENGEITHLLVPKEYYGRAYIDLYAELLLTRNLLPIAVFRSELVCAIECEWWLCCADESSHESETWSAPALRDHESSARFDSAPVRSTLCVVFRGRVWSTVTSTPGFP